MFQLLSGEVEHRCTAPSASTMLEYYCDRRVLFGVQTVQFVKFLRIPSGAGVVMCRWRSCVMVDARPRGLVRCYRLLYFLKPRACISQTFENSPSAFLLSSPSHFLHPSVRPSITPMTRWRPYRTSLRLLQPKGQLHIVASRISSEIRPSSKSSRAYLSSKKYIQYHCLSPPPASLTRMSFLATSRIRSPSLPHEGCKI